MLALLEHWPENLAVLQRFVSVLAAESVRLQNEAIAGSCAVHPERLLGLGRSKHHV